MAKAAVAAPKEPYFAEPLICRKNFEDWGKACRVRAIQGKYNEMLDNAAQDNLSLDQYIKKNFQHHTAFLLTCPQFDFFCWPAALAELGSGIVLYFHFLIFLGCFLLIAFLVQMPAIMEYWGEDKLYLWQAMTGDEVMSNFFIYTSPGMLGPRASDSGQVPFCYFVLVCLLCGLVVAKSAWQLRVDHTVDQGTTQPNDFAIMVEDLPSTATDEQAIMDFFKAHAVLGQETQIAKVVIGWDAAEYREKMAAMGKMKKELRTLPPDDPKVKELMESMTKINADLMSTASDTASRLASSGVVVVSFRYQTDLRRCLDRWQSLWATWAYRDWGGCCGLSGGPPLPKFPTASGIGVWKIKVRRAPNPGDINWDDLGVPKNERFKRLAQTNVAMLLIIGMSFALCYGMVTIKDSVNSAWLGILPALGIATANIGVVFASKYFGEKEYHNTVTAENSSQALKMCLGSIVNTAVVMLAVNPKDSEWYRVSGLASDIMTLIAFTAVLQPMFQLVDLKYSVFQKWKRGKLNEEQLQRLRDGAAWYNSNAVTAETATDFKAFRAEYKQTVDFFNSAFEPSEMDMKRRYAYAVRTFVCCMCYCHLVPFICLVGIAGIVVQYWVDKKMLLRWYKRSAVPQGMDQARMSLYFLRFTTLLMPLCMWFFISPSYKQHNTIIYWMALSYGPATALCVLPLQTIRRIICAPCRGWGQAQVASDETEDYYTAQHMWPKELKYHKSHRLYLGLPEAKNPEMLDPNMSSVTKAEDVKASYGASAASAAAAPPKGSPGTVVLAGGDAIGAQPTEPAVAEPAAEPAASVTPTLIGATDSPTVEPTVVVASPRGEVPAVTPLLLDPGVSSSGGPTWEMEIGHGWSRFDDDCLGHLENMYQKFVNKGGQSRITLRTKGMSLSVDFEKMSQMRTGKGKNKVHKIRRSEGP